MATTRVSRGRRTGPPFRRSLCSGGTAVDSGSRLFRQIQEQREGQDSETIDFASMFGAVDVRDDVSVLARYDRMFDVNPEASKIAYLPMEPDSKSNLLIFGVEYRPLETISVIPNVEYVFFDDPAGPESRDGDWIPRLTFSYRF